MDKINLSGIGNAEAVRASRRVEAESADRTVVAPESASVSKPAATDEIKVSERAAQIERMVARATEAPEIRQERVEALRALVQSGQYDPPASEIAAAIIINEKL